MKKTEFGLSIKGLKKLMLALYLTLLTITVATFIFCWKYINLSVIVVFIFMYVSSTLGTMMGFHRYFSHKSFKCKSWLQILLAIMGSMAGQCPLLDWVATHRKHHRYTDLPGDPHSPLKRGFFHAQTGWVIHVFFHQHEKYVPDILADPLLCKLSRMFPYWVVLGIIIPGIVTGLWNQSWFMAFMGCLWGGPVRIFLVMQSVNLINSMGHLWGTQPYKLKNNSRNNLLVAILTLGEGWHNNHHAYPRSARHGFKAWELDITYIFILLLEKCGIIWDVQRPSVATTENARIGK